MCKWVIINDGNNYLCFIIIKLLHSLFVLHTPLDPLYHVNNSSFAADVGSVPFGHICWAPAVTNGCVCFFLGHCRAAAVLLCPSHPLRLPPCNQALTIRDISSNWSFVAEWTILSSGLAEGAVEPLVDELPHILSSTTHKCNHHWLLSRIIGPFLHACSLNLSTTLGSLTLAWILCFAFTSLSLLTCHQYSILRTYVHSLFLYICFHVQFQSHRYPPFLYQLHQKCPPPSGVEVTSTMCDGGTVVVSEITDLRNFPPNASWCDEFQLLLDELKGMPKKECQAYVSISFLHCGRVITFYRFHVVLVPQVFSCKPDLHPIQLKGEAKPKAMLVYAHTQLKSSNLKEFGIKAHPKGVLLQPQFEGDILELAMSLDELEDVPAGLESTERYLDARILHHLQLRYKEFATPRLVPTVPPVGVAMAVIWDGTHAHSHTVFHALTKITA